MGSSNSMTFHNISHYLLNFSMKFNKQFNRHILNCPPKYVPFALFNYSSPFYIVLIALTSAVTIYRTYSDLNFPSPSINN